MLGVQLQHAGYSFDAFVVGKLSHGRYSGIKLPQNIKVGRRLRIDFGPLLWLLRVCLPNLLLGLAQKSLARSHVVGLRIPAL
jgi:hypothetical protein